jgi:hypothetical protein
MFWNKKKKPYASDESQESEAAGEKKEEINNAPKMGMLQRLAMKRVMSMDPKEREKLMKKALAPENIAKNKDKILATMQQMKESGQLTEEQVRIAKEKLGL